MRHSNRGRRKSGKAFDDKTKYARMLAVELQIQCQMTNREWMILRFLHSLLIRNRRTKKCQH